MSAAVKNVLIIGGGFSGMSAAIQLRKKGIEVDLVEIDPGWRSYGAGITIGGPSLRALNEVGVLDDVKTRGYCSEGVDLFSAEGHPIAQLPTPSCGPGVPGSGGIMRQDLAKILANATRESGTGVRLGCTFSEIYPSDDEVRVQFTDGSSGSYDLVIGADGLYSSTRQAVFPDAPVPRFTRQGVWRAVAPLGDVERAAMFMGRNTKAGFNPISDDQLYLFVTEDRPENLRIPDEELLPRLSQLLEEFSAPVIRRIADSLGPDSLICYRPLEGLLMPRPWYKNRVLLIGDAVHATTPHLASGAGIGIEDAIVIAEELAATDNLEIALEAFQDRRWERCRMVVENSARLGEIEVTGGDRQEHGRIMGESMQALAQPI
ncbi:MAG TPA: FAD-dependent oxidoreductase [Xanthomonadales bacterium]|nr:FAD-dependent oxidoreductase [Xanthomonadales bacterium]